MSESESRSSALHHFAAVPHRAFGDKRFKARHFRVLGAICIAVDRETGNALISQARISKRANISRQYVTPVVGDLEAWGYVRRIARGRSKYGKFKTLIYSVQYDAPPLTRSASGGDAVHVTHVGDTTVSSPEVAESDSLDSDIQDGSDSAGADVTGAPRGPSSRAVAISDDNQLIGRQATNPADSAAVKEAQGHTEGTVANTTLQQGVAISRAEAFERGLRNSADKRICDGLFKAFPGDEGATALEALSPELYESAVDAEMRKDGAGVSMVVRAVRKTMTRKA